MPNSLSFCSVSRLQTVPKSHIITSIMVYDRHQITLDHKCPLSIALLSLSERMYTNLVIFINGCQKYDGLYTFKAVDPLSSLRPLPSNINHPTSVTTVIVKSCHQPSTRLVFHASVRLTWKPPPSSSEMCTPQFQWSVHEPEAHPQLLECRLADKGHPDGQNSFRKKEDERGSSSLLNTI